MLGFMTFSVFGQGNEKPLSMYELGSGYGFGINMSTMVPLELRMTIPLGNLGFTLAGGADFAPNNIGGHGFIGVTYFAINANKMRLPLSFGLSVSGIKHNVYFGISGLVSYHYIFSNNLYIGANVEINYNFGNRYNEIVGNGDGTAKNGVDGSGNTITVFPSPKTDTNNHWGSYVNIKPSICIGYQLK
jgi:hypothetical protein